MGKIQKLVGAVMILVGLFLIGLTFFVEEAKWVSLMYGIPLLVLGIVIFLNKKEDVIEEIKTVEKK